MDNIKYKPNITILLLCDHKKQYQKNILYAWLIVFVLTGIVCCYFLSMDNSYSDIKTDRIITSSLDSYNSNGKILKSSNLSGNRTDKSKNSFFTSAGDRKSVV